MYAARKAFCGCPSGRELGSSTFVPGKIVPSQAIPPCSTYLMFPNPWLWNTGMPIPIWRMVFATRPCVGTLAQVRIPSMFNGLSLSTASLTSVAFRSNMTRSTTVMP